MISNQRWRSANWPLSTKLAAILFLTIALPSLLLLIPYSYYRVNAGVEAEYEALMTGEGPNTLTRIETAMQDLTHVLERQVYTPADFTELENYFYLAPTDLSEQRRGELERFIEAKTLRLMGRAASLSRVRFMDPEGAILVDAVRHEGDTIVQHRAPAQDQTPADAWIEDDLFGPWSTVTDVYADARGNPSIDVIYSVRSPWDQLGTGPILGIVVFTQDLQLAEQDNVLPDLTATLRSITETEENQRVFLLNEEGALLTPNAGRDLFFAVPESTGYQLAQRGAAEVSSYYSPLVDKEVLGYHGTLTARYMPRVTLLIEVPKSTIRQQALQESIFAMLGFVAAFLVLSLLALYIGRRAIISPIREITTVAREIAGGNIVQPLDSTAPSDEIGELGNSFRSMSARLLTTISELETRVAERTRNLETTLEIGRVLTSIHDRDVLLEEVVTLIRDRFERIYHAQVFLTDPVTNRAKLAASTGAVGRTLLQKGHYLEVGSQSVIGNVTATGNAVVALDTSNNPVHRRNEFLPDTRAEMALPLRAGDRIIGALDVQSVDPDAFSDQDVELFQGMADQITIALENATLFEESNQRLQEIERLNRALTDTAWRDTAQHYGSEALGAASGQTAPGGPITWTPLQERAMRTRQIAERIDGDTVIFAVPVLLRDRALGAVEWQVPRARYTANTRQTAEELTTRLALTVDNIRLFEQSRQAIQREQLVNQISSKLIGQTDVDQILQTAVRELGLALRAPRTAIRLRPSNHETVDD